MPPAGWVVAVLVERPGEPAPLRRYFAVGQSDRAKAEWTAVDAALTLGPVASSPHAGQEPVETLASLSAARMARLGLGAGQVRDLGDLWPRRWVAPG